VFAEEEPMIAQVIVGIVNQDVENNPAEELFRVFASIVAV
jgi:hypothetical protein